MRYPKPYKTVAEQRALLEGRGMVITDPAKAEHYLSNIGYYHLSAYWYPFRQVNAAGDKIDTFAAGTQFDTVVDLYVFDKRLRLTLLDLLERIEIALRTDITLQLGKTDIHAHLNPRNFDGNFTKQNYKGKSRLDYWLEKVDFEMRNSKEDFVKHFKAKYTGYDVPIWIATELISFGALSHLFEGMKHRDKVTVSAKYGLPRHIYLSSGLKTLTFVRNVCAHHGRLWNRPIINQLQLPRPGDVPDLDHIQSNKRLYSAVAFAVHLLNTINPTSSWRIRFKDLMDTFPAQPTFMPTGAGFQNGWQAEDLWD